MNKKLPELGSLADYQAYVRQIVTERQFEDVTLEQNCLLLGEEVGELFKAIRKQVNLSTAQDSDEHEVAHELVDVLIFVLAIANKLDIDLTSAFVEKETINMRRHWRKV
ncbi:MazG nucleotide pyrophosphohydrolase domain-containing protein [Vibrio tubiashii]|uniref:NTP pyrophosphohydrolase MazG-like domain-containing protein n=1 Tax=Vibrio tubiashii ATCC 19109 TaxID=1051646 RepID=F9T4F1_9VIBR|nr:MazG nucleotide pyrophosphohydrolase domain-containing protein [Vibrio tubiashii]AIW13323.1 hypothetical protein IX91_03765 [Vibrio tubiashii ATCC 19109]EGU56062.1 hypothetical protein VITU9109_08877 [Vibrio tubiashii ATCC 19109]EIF04459.1 hypothetical protein VT1337_08311 [Vibrio tubiashii NCIMB 1337 = ATCC 19106]